MNLSQIPPSKNFISDDLLHGGSKIIDALISSLDPYDKLNADEGLPNKKNAYGDWLRTAIEQVGPSGLAEMKKHNLSFEDLFLIHDIKHGLAKPARMLPDQLYDNNYNKRLEGK